MRVGALPLGIMSRLIQVVRMLHQVCSRILLGLLDGVRCGVRFQ